MLVNVHCTEPWEWIDKYEWRRLSENERLAMYNLWIDIGTRMGIEDMGDTWQELKAWSDR